MDEGESNETSTGTSDGFVELVRVTNRIQHASPTDRSGEKDIVVRNNSDEDKSYLLLPLSNFHVNLQVFDEDDTKLNVFPNDEVEAMREEIEEEEPETHETIEKRLDGEDYLLYIQLPDDNPIEPGELRTITLTYGQSEAAEVHKITDPPKIKGWLTHWKRKFFTVPSFAARADRTSSEDHDEFFIVEGPLEYATVAESSKDKLGLDGMYENGYGDDTRILSTRLPAPDSGGNGYTWNLQYEFLTDRRGLMRILAIFWVVAFFSGIALVLGLVFHLAGCWSIPNVVDQPNILSDLSLHKSARTYSTIMSSGIIGVMYALRTEWAERYRLLSLIPLVLHGLAWALWSLIL